MLSPIRPSVYMYLSVTRVDQSKTIEVRFTYRPNVHYRVATWLWLTLG